MKILIDYDLNDKYIEQIRKAVPEGEIVKAENREKQEEEIVDTNVLISFMGFPLDILQHEENMKWIQCWSAGVDSFTEPDYVSYLKDNNILLTNMSGIHKNAMADHTFGFIINFSRRFCEMKDLQRNNKWEVLRVGQLEGKTMAVIGLGSIGQEIADRGKAFKMRVIGVKRNIDQNLKNVDQLFSPEKLDRKSVV